MVCGEPLYSCDDPEVNFAKPKSALSSSFVEPEQERRKLD